VAYDSSMIPTGHPPPRSTDSGVMLVLPTRSDPGPPGLVAGDVRRFVRSAPARSVARLAHLTNRDRHARTREDQLRRISRPRSGRDEALLPGRLRLGVRG